MNDELFTQRAIDVDLADDWRRCFAISFRDEKEMSRCHSNRLKLLPLSEISAIRKRWPVAIAITANSDWLKTEFSELKEIQPVVNKYSHP